LLDATGFFFTTALALAFCSDFTLRGADFADFGFLGAADFAGFETLGAGFFAEGFAVFPVVAFFAAGFLAAGLGTGFLAALGGDLDDFEFALPGIAGRKVSRKDRRLFPDIPGILSGVRRPGNGGRDV
jgi:hypothetical protein